MKILCFQRLFIHYVDTYLDFLPLFLNIHWYEQFEAYNILQISPTRLPLPPPTHPIVYNVYEHCKQFENLLKKV